MTSRALQYARYGGPEVLELVERETPEPGAGQVRLAVRAAAVNPLDWKLRSGAMAAQDAPDTPQVPGFDVAGIVTALGDGVTGVRVGEEVLGAISGGAFAEEAVLDADGLVGKPDQMAWETAAALPVVVTTAYRVLDQLGLGAGDHTGTTLVIDGASGGVGVFAVQIAVARGVRVIGTAGAAHQDDVAALGATPVVYGEGLAERVRGLAPEGVDAAFDTAGKGSLPDLIALTGSADRVITIADPTAGDHGVRFSGGGVVEGSLAEAVARVADGSMRAPATVTYPFEQAAQAQHDNETGRVSGKLVVIV